MTSPAHRKASGGGSDGWTSPSHLLVGGLAAVVVLGGAAAGVLIANRHHSSSPSASGASVTATRGRHGHSSAPPTTTPAPLTVASISPTEAATKVATDHDITVTFSAPLAPGAPDPRLTPKVAGHWTQSGREMVFTPSAGYTPFTSVRITIPAGVAATEGGRSVELASAYHSSFSVQPGSIQRLQELLAELKYLPVTFTPHNVTTDALTTNASGQPTATSALAQEPTAADEVRTTDVAGSFAWAYPNTPTALAALWKPGDDDQIVRGAVMAFEANQGLAVDGIAGPEVWTALLHAVAARQTDPHPYNYLEVSEASPETLRVWQDGKIVFTSLANTGVPGANTALGTYPIYTHEASTTMKGTDVNGTKYDVEVYDVGYFFDGDAVHGYPRSAYGFPQSNGCVELPLQAAAQIFNDGENDYGVLVTVSPA